MSQLRPDIDLAALSRPSEIASPRRSSLRYVVPAALLIGLALLLFSTAGDLWRGAVEVTVIRPRALTPGDSSAAAASAGGAPLFQAAGWVEPDPFPTEVTALASGVVRELLVQESDVVEAGQIVARLIEEDAELALRQAQAAEDAAAAGLALAQAELQAAVASFDAALSIIREEKVARADLDGRIAEAAQRKAAVERAQARVAIAEEELALQEELAASDARGPRQVELAAAKLAELRAEIATLAAEQALAEARTATAEADLERAVRDRELRIGDKERVDKARAMLEQAQADLDAARAARETAALERARMEVRAPVGGVVLERRAAPGSMLGGASGETDSVVCTLYDPSKIRVRVDVPQGELEKVGVGMRAQILSDTRSSGPYQGEVIRLVHKADIQKVTLQVHVRVLDPDELLRPEMLCQVRFLGNASVPEEGGGSDVVVPSRLLVEGSKLWVVDGVSGRAALRTVHVRLDQGDEVVLDRGVNVTDKLIDLGRDRVKPGDKLAIRSSSAQGGDS